MTRLPIVNIEQVAEELSVTRKWINERWLKTENPPPHFRDGDSVFFELQELQQWAKRRALGSDSIDMPDDLTD